MSIHPGDLIVFGYAQTGGSGIEQRQGQVDAVNRCKAGHTTITMLDDDRRALRQFKLHKMFIRTVIPCVNNPTPLYYWRV